MTSILAIETATSSCSAAVRVNDEIVTRNEVGNNVHSKVLLSMVESLLLEARLSPQELDAVAVGQGPGSFTGLRIGVGVGQGLAFGANCPMIGVSSLDALALQAHDSGRVIAAIDARMGEVYWCEYQKQGRQIERIGALRVTSPVDVALSDGSAIATLVGNAWSAYEGRFSSLESVSIHQEDTVIYPSAGSLLNLAEEKYQAEDWMSAAVFAPIYVRDDVAKKSTKKLPGRRPD